MQKTIRGTLPLGFPVLVIAIILFLSALHNAVTEELNIAYTITAPLRNAVYNNSLSESEIHSMFRSTLDSMDSSGPGKALTWYYLGRYYQAVETREAMAAYVGDLRKGRYLALRKYYTRREEALNAYRNARTAAENYLEFAPSAEAHSLLGEILGQMLFLGSAGQALAIGPKARKQVKIALELNPNYPRALIQEASRLAYSPSIYGGNPEDARALYRRILRQGGLSREDEFNVYGGFAMASFMEGDYSQALSWFTEALTLYPGNIFALGMADYLLELREEEL